MANSAIGYVLQIGANGIASSDSGIVRKLLAGDPVFANDVVTNSGQSDVLIDLVDGTQLAIAPNTSASLNVSDANQTLSGIGTTDTSLSPNAIQERLLAGEDPDLIAAATAAGEEEGDNGGISILPTVALSGLETIPDSGFETTGINFQFNEVLDELLFNPNNNPEDGIAALGGELADTGLESLSSLPSIASVDEAALSTGSLPASNNESTTGSLEFTSINPAVVSSVNGVDVSSVGLTTINGLYGDLLIDANGNYTYTLLTTASHANPSAVAQADIELDLFTFNVTDSTGLTVANALTIQVLDDGPSVTPNTNSVDDFTLGTTTNLVIGFDRSASFDVDPGIDGFAQRIDLARAALADLFEGYDLLGDVNILIVDFANTATNSGWLTGPASANNYLDALIADGNTNYQAAIDEIQASYNTGLPAGADQTLLYFLSDGDPNLGDFPAVGVPEYESFLTNNNIDVAFGIGVGDILTTDGFDALDAVAFPNGNDSNPFIVTNEVDLSAQLISTVSSSVVTGTIGDGMSGTVGAETGADGGYLQSIEIDGALYTFTPDNITAPTTGQISVSGIAGSISGTVFTMTTDLGGQFTFDFLTGDYSYRPTQVDGQQNELFTYTIVDGDQDQNSSTLTITVNDITFAPTAVGNTVLTNIVDGSTINIPDASLLDNDLDVLNTALSITDMFTNVVGGSVAHDAVNNNVQFTASAPGAFSANFDYQATTANAQTSSATVSINSVAGTAINGGATDEIIIGRDDANNTLLGNAGNDQIFSGAGNDTLRGGSGNDELTAGAGNDNLFGDSGADRLNGDVGDDVLDGGAGNDFLNGGTGSDSLLGGDGKDTLNGGDGNDTLRAGSGNDTLIGGAGNDELVSDGGVNSLLGGSGDDILIGNNTGLFSDNTLAGGAGSDTLVDAVLSSNTIVINFDDVGTGVDQAYGFDNVASLFASFPELQDSIDISDVLVGAGFDSMTDLIEDYVQVTFNEGGDNDLHLSVDTDGLANGANFQEVLVLHDESTTLNTNTFGNGFVTATSDSLSNFTTLQQLLDNNILIT